jgi:glycosyltransferase involved in cell wall biosynthesis
MNLKLNNTKIAFFLPSLAGGGAERAMLHLAESFVKRDIQVDMVLSRAEGEYLEQVAKGVRIVNLYSKYPKILGLWYNTQALKKYLQQEQPTSLISTLDIFGTATWSKRLEKIPTKIVLCVQNNLSQRFQSDRSLLMGKVKFQLVKSFYPWADKIVASSKGVAEDLAKITNIPVSEIEVIYNPVVKPDLLIKAQEAIDHPWFAPEQPPVILGAGRLVKQKDFVTLIKAFDLVRQQREAKLMILGDGEASIKHQLTTLVTELGLENDVTLPGFVQNPYAYMARAAVFVLSSIYEGFGNVVAEALAVGTPVVSTDCESGPAEILEYGKYGNLAPVGDFQALGDGILAMLANPTDPEILRQRALEFSVDRISDRYLEVLLAHK